MKGQLSIDVIIAMLIFVTFISYLLFQLLAFGPLYLQQLRAERVRGEAYQLSELLINDPGEPIDWTSTNVRRIGLSDQNLNLTNLISWSKVLALNSICMASYEEVRKKLGVEEYQFMVWINNTATGSSILCSPPPAAISIGIINFTVKRVVGISEGGSRFPGEIVVRVW